VSICPVTFCHHAANTHIPRSEVITVCCDGPPHSRDSLLQEIHRISMYFKTIKQPLRNSLWWPNVATRWMSMCQCVLNQQNVILSRVSKLTRDIDIANLYVRLSVSDENGLTYRHSFFSPYGSPTILVLPASNIFTKFRRGHSLRGH